VQQGIRRRYRKLPFSHTITCYEIIKKSPVASENIAACIAGCSLWLWPATDHEPHRRHMPTNKIWRRTESTPRSGWRHSNAAGIYSDCRPYSRPLVLAEITMNNKATITPAQTITSLAHTHTHTHNARQLKLRRPHKKSIQREEQ